MRVVTPVYEMDIDEADAITAASIAKAALQAGIANSESLEEAERLIRGVEHELERQKNKAAAMYF